MAIALGIFGDSESLRIRNIVDKDGGGKLERLACFLRYLEVIRDFGEILPYLNSLGKEPFCLLRYNRLLQ